MTVQAANLSGGRLHLQHGPIDLVIGAEGAARAKALRAARVRFEGLLETLVGELPILRRAVAPIPPAGPVARRMHRAVLPHRATFVTPMAAVAGAVADEILAAMCAAGPLRRAYVNNGGDIAVHLAPGTAFRIAVQGLDASDHGQIAIRAEDGIGGIATSGRGGRSHTLGIADGVTVLAPDAAAADAAATLIGNAVDLPGHPSIHRRPAHEIDPDSDLGDRAVVVGLGPLTPGEARAALLAGRSLADDMRQSGLIAAAALMCMGQVSLVGEPMNLIEEGALADA